MREWTVGECPTESGEEEMRGCYGVRVIFRALPPDPIEKVARQHNMSRAFLALAVFFALAEFYSVRGRGAGFPNVVHWFDVG